MGLRCIIGHDYGDPQRTEEREERGDEVVVTVREYRECNRCGHRKTISENTEVRTSETPERGDAGPADGEGDAATTGDPPGGPDETAHPSMGRDAPGESPTGSAAGDPGTTTTPEANVTGAQDGATRGDDIEDVTAAEDDGVILEDDADDDDRERGEWPEADDADGGPDDDREDGNGAADEGAEPGAAGGGWPTPDAEDEGYAAEPTSGGPGDGVDFGGGLTPERSEPGATAGDAPTRNRTAESVGSGSAETDAASGIARADSEPAARQPPADSGAVLSCPRCGHTAPSRASSLRPGDICPECAKGYLTEREG